MLVLTRKITIIFLLTVLMACLNYYPVNGQIIPLALIEKAEQFLYGQSSELPIKDRIEQLEFTLYNNYGTESLQERAEQIIHYVLGSDVHPSLIFLFNTLEWTLTNRSSQGNLLYRLAELEKIVFGMVQKGALVARIKQLEELSLPAGQVKQQEANLTEDIEITITLLEEIDSARIKAGELIKYQVEESIKIDNILVIPAGTTGHLKISKVRPAGRFGRDGQVAFARAEVTAIDGSLVPVQLINNDDNSYSQEIAIGLSVLGTVIVSHPVGLLAGLLYNGQEAVIPANSSFRLVTTRGVKVRGLAL